MKNSKILFSILLASLLFVFTSSTFSQTDKSKEPPVMMIVEQMPSFPGGEDSLYKFLSSHIQYPAIAKEKGISGTVIINFIVEQDGRVSNAEILKSIGGGCDEEALRVIKSMPNWIPGKQSGQAVRVQYNLPIKFSLS